MSKHKSPQHISASDLQEKLSITLQRAKRYSVLAFIVFVALIYGFILLRISNLSNAQPSADAVTSQVKAARLPHIDQSVVEQLQSLQDNSVNVKALFSQTRNNPFQ